jgi:GDP-L-fucose synthase
MISTDASTTRLYKGSAKLPADTSIYVAGHRGMVGSAIVRHLQNDGYRNVITRSSAELDLTVQQAVDEFFNTERVQAVVLAAARVGGIYANSAYPAEFMYQNLMIQNNVIHAAYANGIDRLLFLGSSCIYPRLAPQPMREEYLLSGYLEPTNEPYALAKIAGIKMCESYNRQYGTRYRTVMPTNLYGPNDNFDLETSHVLPAMIRKFHLTKLALQGKRAAIERDIEHFGPLPRDIHDDLMSAVQARLQNLEVQPAVVRLWGSGSPRREFLHVDDMASACLFIMNLTDEMYQAACMSALNKDASLQPESDSPGVSFLNIGSGIDIAIKDLAEIIKSETGCTGQAVWDSSKPDGMPRKLLDVTRLNALGWKPQIDLRLGIRQTYQWYLEATENP